MLDQQKTSDVDKRLIRNQLRAPSHEVSALRSERLMAQQIHEKAKTS